MKCKRIKIFLAVMPPPFPMSMTHDTMISLMSFAFSPTLVHPSPPTQLSTSRSQPSQVRKHLHQATFFLEKGPSTLKSARRGEFQSVKNMNRRSFTFLFVGARDLASHCLLWFQSPGRSYWRGPPKTRGRRRKFYCIEYKV